MGENLIIPQDPNASEEAREELGQLGDLFGPTALDTRLELIEVAARRRGGLPFPEDDGLAAKVQRSIRWATVTEVALRLIFDDADPRTLAQLDAMAAAMRISRGLAERRQGCELDLVDALTEVADEIRENLQIRPEFLAPHRQAISVFRAHTAHLMPWTAAEVEVIVTALPVRMVLSAAAGLAPLSDPYGWPAMIGGAFGICQYLALDLGLLLGAAPPDGDIVSPARDCIRLDADGKEANDSANSSQVISDCVPILEASAVTLQAQIEAATSEGAPEIVVQYAKSALIAAATAYQGLVAQGRV